MSWYPAEMVRCPRCRSRHSTPIDKLNHQRNCRVPTDGQGGVIAKVGTHGSESIKVTRGIIEEGKSISFIRANGVKYTGRVTNIVRDVAVFIEL